jgi:hypothetical protein
VACRGTHGLGDPPDLVAAVGRADEEGLVGGLDADLRGAAPRAGSVDPPFRVDVVIRDPKVPAVSYGDYRDFNRIVRYDATSAHPLWSCSSSPRVAIPSSTRLRSTATR